MQVTWKDFFNLSGWWHHTIKHWGSCLHIRCQNHFEQKAEDLWKPAWYAGHSSREKLYVNRCHCTQLRFKAVAEDLCAIVNVPNAEIAYAKTTFFVSSSFRMTGVVLLNKWTLVVFYKLCWFFPVYDLVIHQLLIGMHRGFGITKLVWILPQAANLLSKPQLCPFPSSWCHRWCTQMLSHMPCPVCLQRHEIVGCVFFWKSPLPS